MSAEGCVKQQRRQRFTTELQVSGCSCVHCCQTHDMTSCRNHAMSGNTARLLHACLLLHADLHMGHHVLFSQSICKVQAYL